MIKLKDILLEGVNPSQIMEIVHAVYPYIVKDLGGRKLKVEVHNNIYRRLNAVGEEDLMKQNNPYAQYDWDTKKIYLYESAITNIEQVIRSLLHEHTHSRQDKKKFDYYYDEKNHTYQSHPFEKAAIKAESRWKNYLRYLDEM